MKTKTTQEQISGKMLERGKKPLLNSHIVTHGDSIGCILPDGSLYEQFARGNARGRTGEEAAQMFGQFYRSTK